MSGRENKGSTLYGARKAKYSVGDWHDCLLNVFGTFMDPQLNPSSAFRRRSRRAKDKRMANAFPSAWDAGLLDTYHCATVFIKFMFRHLSSGNGK